MNRDFEKNCFSDLATWVHSFIAGEDFFKSCILWESFSQVAVKMGFISGPFSLERSEVSIFVPHNTLEAEGVIISRNNNLIRCNSTLIDFYIREITQITLTK